MKLPWNATKRSSPNWKTLTIVVLVGGTVAYFATNSKRRGQVKGATTGALRRIRGARVDDATLTDKIRSEALGSFRDTSINVNVENGVAILRGQVKSEETSSDIEQSVRKVSGVIDVRNFLSVSGESPAPPA
jgi:osmotically-inducible protein OsmY